MKITNPQNISGNPLLSQVAVSGGHLSGAGTSASPLTVGGYVETTTTVNGKALSSNVVITALDVKMTSANDAPTVQAKINSIEQQITGGGEVTVSPITYNDNPISSIVAGSNVSMTYSAGALTVNATATKITVDAGISSNSTNPVQNRAVYSALSSKADSSVVANISARVSALETQMGNVATILAGI